MSVAISVVNIFVCSGDEFAVVIFPEEDCSLGIVHESWLNEDHDKTLWPNEKNPNKRRRLTVQGAAPTEAWIEVKCIVKAWADSYERAVERAQYLEYTSDATSERELGRGKRKRRSTVPSDCDSRSSSNSSGSDTEYVPPKPPTPPLLKKKSVTFSSASVHQPGLYERASHPSGYPCVRRPYSDPSNLPQVHSLAHKDRSPGSLYCAAQPEVRQPQNHEKATLNHDMAQSAEKRLQCHKI
ncbi:uncharacterized protein LOC144158044 [Haemaphysalis longicornis]